MKVVKNLMFVAFAALVSVSAMADGGKNAALKPVVLKVDTKVSAFNWLGKKFTGEHIGTIGVQSGSLVLNAGKLSGGEFTIDMKSIKCLDLTDAGYNAKLVGHLTSPDFFDIAKYPTATLKITKVAAKTATNYDITGNLTINGVTQPITFPALVTITKDATTAAAKFEIDRTKFGSKFGSKSFFESIGDKMIYDNFQVDVKIVAAK